MSRAMKNCTFVLLMTLCLEGLRSYPVSKDLDKDWYPSEEDAEETSSGEIWDQRHPSSIKKGITSATIRSSISIDSEDNLPTKSLSSSKGNRIPLSKTDQNRADRVAALKIEYEQLKKTVLRKDLRTLTKAEQFQVASLRYKLQRSRDNLAPYKDAHAEAARAELLKMKKALPKANDFLDTTSEAYRVEKKQRDLYNSQRHRTRKKVQKLGINVQAQSKRGSAPLQDNAPPLIMKKRRHNAAYRQRVKDRLRIEREALFVNGWALRKHRSQ